MARILAETLATLGTLGRASPAWTAYTRYIADIVVAGLRQSALVSLRYLRKLVCSSSLLRKHLTSALEHLQGTG